ncbi:MAG: hypothetical protein M3Y85_04300 [Bacteroidota bacterium]|nr:hypothetical protein [Bacteroidota bacterium]
MEAKKFLAVLFSFTFFLCACKKDKVPGHLDYQTLGTAANSLLSSSNYSILQIEIDYMPGYTPDAMALTNLVNFLNARINKTGGVQVITRQINSGNAQSLSLSDIVSIEKNNRIYFTGGNVMGVYILITDGYSANMNTFATAYWNTSYCIFGKAINDNSGALFQVSRTRLMTTILEHEFGHLLGLVDQGTPMVVSHRDASNGAHCNNTGCLMYFGIETASTFSTSGSIPLFDANCLADLKANGGK